MPVRRAGAANAGLRVPGAAAVVNPRLPCRATRDGRRGPRAPVKPSPLPDTRGDKHGEQLRVGATLPRDESRWRRRVVPQSS